MIGGVVLAAGGSARFGSPKQLADLGGRPLLQHAVDAMLGVPAIEDVVVVLGANADAIEAAVDPGRARLVLCTDWHRGQAASLRCGLSALCGHAPVVVVLGDGPHVTPELITAVLQRAGDGSARATFDGRPGHPVVLGRSELARAGELAGDAGFRDLLDSARTFEASHLADPHDIDTPQDLEKIKP
ncbi:MAG: nucleotidyltransferase family protein [Actinomycetota bacterium]|nr:nucleotidyltransferase family protein [Actinomycetota bacterium]